METSRRLLAVLAALEELGDEELQAVSARALGLLLAPLARAAQRGTGSLRDGIREVLASTTVADAVEAYAAIRKARPGGLGSATSEDVAAVPRLFGDPDRGDEIDEVLPGTWLGQQGRVAPLLILRKALRRLAQADHQGGVCLRL